MRHVWNKKRKTVINSFKKEKKKKESKWIFCTTWLGRGSSSSILISDETYMHGDLKIKDKYQLKTTICNNMIICEEQTRNQTAPL